MDDFTVPAIPPVLSGKRALPPPKRFAVSAARPVRFSDLLPGRKLNAHGAEAIKRCGDINEEHANGRLALWVGANNFGTTFDQSSPPVPFGHASFALPHRV